MTEHTDREFELESKLFDVLFNLRMLELVPAATITNPSSGGYERRDALLKLHYILEEFNKDINSQLQHPRWAELNKKAEDDFYNEMDAYDKEREQKDGQP